MTSYFADSLRVESSKAVRFLLGNFSKTTIMLTATGSPIFSSIIIVFEMSPSLSSLL